MTSLKVRVKGGLCTTIEVVELLEVDGKAYQAAGESELDIMGLRLANLEGRVQTIENIFTQREVETCQP